MRPTYTGLQSRPRLSQATLSSYQALIGKEGQPNGPLETLELKIRGDSHLLQIEQFDKAGTLVQVSSTQHNECESVVLHGSVNDGSNLSLYLDSNDGNGYVLQGTTPVSGALYQGSNGNDWDNTWSIGRGFYDGPPGRLV